MIGHIDDKDMYIKTVTVWKIGKENLTGLGLEPETSGLPDQWCSNFYFFCDLFVSDSQHVCQIVIILFIAGGLFMFTYESTQFNAEGFILVLVASVTSGIRWSLAQILTQKQELGESKSATHLKKQQKNDL